MPKKKSGMSNRDKALYNRGGSKSPATRASDKKYREEYDRYFRRVSNRPYENKPYIRYEDGIDAQGDLFRDIIPTPRRTRSTDSVGRTRSAEARRRSQPKPRKSGTSGAKGKKSAIDFGNR